MNGEQRRRFQEHGFVVIEGVLEAAVLSRVRARVEALFEAAGENAGHEFQRDPYGRRVTDLDPRDEELSAAVRHPTVTTAAESVLGPGCRLVRLSAGSRSPFAPVGETMPAETGEGLCAVWLLDPSTTIRFVAGSHREDAGSHDASPACPEETTLTASAGGVVLFGSRLVYGGAPNPTGRHLRTLHGVFAAADEE